MASYIFREDSFGFLHYENRNIWTNLQEAAEDACAQMVGKKAAFFWWRATPAPIHPADTPASLVQRWTEWRKRYNEDHRNLLEDLDAMRLQPTPLS